MVLQYLGLMSFCLVAGVFVETMSWIGLELVCEAPETVNDVIPIFFPSHETWRYLFDKKKTCLDWISKRN
jgi:hypothetical protein